MRKGFLFWMTAVLACFVLVGTACADYGYTSVSQIPMAVDFNFRIDSYESGKLEIVTDYPFEATGASEINLLYETPDGEEVFTLNYQYPSGVTRVGSYNGNYLSTDSMAEAYRLVQSGKAKWDGQVYINTSHFSTATDWILVYTTTEDSGNSYTSYEERTYAQAFNAMAPGGVSKCINYQNGQIVKSSLNKRIVDADLRIYYNQYGDIESGEILQYTPEFQAYFYDTYNGLFSGHKIMELGFSEADLQTEPLAAIGERTGVPTVADDIVVFTYSDVITNQTDTVDTTETTTTVAVEPEVPAVQADNGNFRFATSLIGGLMIGLVLYYGVRRWIYNRKMARMGRAEAAKQSAKDLADAVSSLEKAPSNPEEYVEPPVQQYHNK